MGKSKPAASQAYKPKGFFLAPEDRETLQPFSRMHGPRGAADLAGLDHRTWSSALAGNACYGGTLELLTRFAASLRGKP
jgi:hypothetical protein